MEVSPNKILLTYDQSDFCSYEFPDAFVENKIVGLYVDIDKD